MSGLKTDTSLILKRNSPFSGLGASNGFSSNEISINGSSYQMAIVT